MMQELFAYFLQHPVVTTDSRNITPGCIFFALKGENFNGNDFLSKALEEGAGLVIGDEDRGIQDARCMIGSIAGIGKNVSFDMEVSCCGHYREQWKDNHQGIGS
jgi:UDP-N-acetylmuramyl tripeptide synthase